jgi:pimeloyl-ACP methyl ester carboxylesterase
MIERLHVFGKGNRLCGITSEPSKETRKENAPAFLIINAGILPHTGPYRIHVDLSRRLAENGYTSLRFDMSGMGDSLHSIINRPEHQRVLNDVVEAMDLLQAKCRINKFVAYGICRGALIAHDIAIMDKRVIGTVQVDSYAYPTPRFFIHDRVLPLLSLKKWLGFIRKKLKRDPASPSQSPEPTQRFVFKVQFEPKKKTVSEIEQLVARGVHLLYIYSGGILGIYNYGNQFWDMFKGVDFSELADLAYFEGADHLFGPIKVRADMMDCVVKWMNKSFGINAESEEPRSKPRGIFHS